MLSIKSRATHQGFKPSQKHSMQSKVIRYVQFFSTKGEQFNQQLWTLNQAKNISLLSQYVLFISNYWNPVWWFINKTGRICRILLSVTMVYVDIDCYKSTFHETMYITFESSFLTCMCWRPKESYYLLVYFRMLKIFNRNESALIVRNLHPNTQPFYLSAVVSYFW